MKAIDGYFLINPEELSWKPANPMRIPYAEVLWLIIGAPENELEPGESFDIKRFWPVDPKQLPKELGGVIWPPKE